jgi:integrase
MRGHIRRRGSRWVAVVYMGRDAQGRDRYKWQTCSTRREAEAAARQMIAMAEGGTLGAARRMTTGELLRRWLEDSAAGRVAPTTEAIYRAAVSRYLAPLGHVPLHRLSPHAIQAHLSGLLRRGLSPATVHQAYRVLHTALRAAVTWGVLTRNPCEAVRPPSVPERSGAVWDEEQVRLFLAEARRSSPHYCLYLTLLLTGMRPGEALALRWEDVNLLVGEALVRRKFYRLGAREIWGAPKTGRIHAVALPRVLVDELARHRQLQVAALQAAGAAWEETGLVFCQPNGRPLHEKNILRRDFRRVIERAGVPRIRLYDLRHCHATHLAEMGVPVSVIQRRMRHSNPSTSLRYYVHVLPHEDRRAVERLSGRFAPSSCKWPANERDDTGGCGATPDDKGGLENLHREPLPDAE